MGLALLFSFNLSFAQTDQEQASVSESVNDVTLTEADIREYVKETELGETEDDVNTFSKLLLKSLKGGLDKSSSQSCDIIQCNFRIGLIYHYKAEEFIEKEKQVQATQNYNESARWYRIAANEHKDKIAAYNLGIFHKMKYVSDASIDKAIYWFELAHQLGDDDSSAYLGDIYGDKAEKFMENGEQEQSTQNYDESAKWFAIAANNHKNKQAAYILGIYHERKYVSDASINKAIEWFLKAHELGHAKAASQLGGLYRVQAKKYFSKGNEEEGINYFKKAIKYGDVKSVLDLGFQYLISKKYNDAKTMLESQYGKLKEDEIAFMIAKMYLNGLLPDKNNIKAKEWLEKVHERIYAYNFNLKQELERPDNLKKVIVFESEYYFNNKLHKFKDTLSVIGIDRDDALSVMLIELGKDSIHHDQFYDINSFFSHDDKTLLIVNKEGNVLQLDYNDKESKLKVKEKNSMSDYLKEKIRDKTVTLIDLKRVIAVENSETQESVIYFNDIGQASEQSAVKIKGLNSVLDIYVSGDYVFIHNVNQVTGSKIVIYNKNDLIELNPKTQQKLKKLSIDFKEELMPGMTFGVEIKKMLTSPDEKSLYVVYKGNEIIKYNIDSENHNKTDLSKDDGIVLLKKDTIDYFTNSDDPIRSIAISPNGETLAVGYDSDSGNIKLIKTTELNEKPISTIKAHTSEIVDLLFLNNKELVSLSKDSFIKFWDLNK
jgi:TPR repeat protein